MTFLRQELTTLNEQFDAQWIHWQTQANWSVVLTHQAATMWNPYAISFYEYYPHLSLRSVRQITLAATAISMAQFLWQNHLNEGISPAQMEEAEQWLIALAQRHLNDLLSPENQTQFWQSYQQSQQAFAAERPFLQSAAQPYPLANYQALLHDQIALSRFTLQLFTDLSGNQRPAHCLAQSQHEVYAGLQWHHQVLHWKKAYVSGQFSYVLRHFLAQTPRLTPADTPAERQAQLELVGKYFYYTGWAEQTLQWASDAFCRAMAAVTDLPPNSWGATVANLLDRNEHLRKDLHQIRQKQLTKINQSITPIPATPISLTSINQALSQAVSYFIQEQAPDGRWGDFLLLGEQSTHWVTGYVGWTLSQIPATVLPDPDVLSRAAQWLVADELPTRGWGYNNHWPLDGDSIANTILFLAQRPDVAATVWQPALDILLSHQKTDGGFCTILDPEAWLLRFRTPHAKLTGWTSSHACVTAVTAVLLAILDNGRYQPQAERALAYLRHCQHPDGYWPAYWWAGAFYTTCRTLQAMAHLPHPANASAISAAVRWLTANQQPDGRWSPEPHSTTTHHGEAFHTSLALQALMACSPSQNQQAALQKGFQWLLRQQLPDGSWPVGPILRVPLPQMVAPWHHEQWLESILGLNVIVPDWHRLFTTATAVQALSGCLKEPDFLTAEQTIPLAI